MMVRDSLAEKVAKDSKEKREGGMGTPRGSIFHQEETSSAKALRWNMLPVVME